jgi:hypothetical protein
VCEPVKGTTKTSGDREMKNGFDLMNTVRVWCYANHYLLTQMHYSLKGEYAIFVAEKIGAENDDRFALMRWTAKAEFEVCKWYLSKPQALQMLVEQYDEMQRGES